ncbi:MAG: Hsp20/alpha crystallin family protein [Parcubacteria group bacterium]|nr:Hsp20/alpha crystallin family protein [Parcubacteria group bacterium]
MAIIKWNPFADLDRFFDDADFVPFLPIRRLHQPSADVSETAENVIVEMPLAGIDPANVEISVENDLLTVHGTTEQAREGQEKNYHRKEIRRGSFSRTLTLPKPVKGDEAKAEYEKGILTITIPKDERAKPKKIDIQVK